MALSSASLLSPSFQITNEVYNTVRNSVEIGGVNCSPYFLIPSFNSDLLTHAYRQMITRPDNSIEFIAQHSNFLFFFYKKEGRVYQVVSNRDVTEIYRVTEEHL